MTSPERVESTWPVREKAGTYSGLQEETALPFLLPKQDTRGLIVENRVYLKLMILPFRRYVRILRMTE
jgi:hypothetical protein